jgi:diguanylate cyclase (GGDEF)-like protein
MQRIGTFSRVFAILILVIVASAAVYGYVSFSATGSINDSIRQTSYWYARYQKLDALVVKEISAQDGYGTTIAERNVEEALLTLRRLARRTPERSAVLLMLRAQQDGSYRALHDFIGMVMQKRLVYAEALRQRLEMLQRQLEWAMVGIGLFGLAVAEVATQLELRRLKRAVRSDGLTSLGNHRAFRDDLAREISRSLRHGHAMTLALIDLDDFKSLNDSNGHWRGDEVLIQTARVLESGRQEDRAYRIGGDEFAVLLTETNADRARTALERLHDELKRRPGTASVSIGYCELEKGFEGHDVYERADAALYEAKKSGRDTIVDFASIRERTTIFSAQKASSLHTLLQSGALAVAFQPIWDMSGRHVLGFEALARPNPALGFTGPEEAFDVAEHQRRVTDLDRLCIEKILAAAAGLPRDQLVFVNVTPETLGRPDFRADRLAASVRAVGLEPRQVVIEVTERRVADPDELVRRVRELRELGMLVALDDTGAGHAGLEILSKVTFDFVKIDRSVVLEAMVHKRARGVLAGIVAIAREGESFVIAEGVESIEQFLFIRTLRGPQLRYGDIAGVQGYLLGRPRCGSPDAAEFAEDGRILENQSELVS